MELTRQIVSIARSLRADNNVRVRQPVSELAVAMPQTLDPELEELILDELNVKGLRRVGEASELFNWQAKGDMKSLGPKYGSRLKEVLGIVAGLDNASISKVVADGQLTVNGLTLHKEDLLLSQQPVEGYWVKSDGNLTVAVSNKFDEDLISEWLAREFVHHVQNMRRDADLEVTQRITIEFSAGEMVNAALDKHRDYVCNETLAVSLTARNGLENDPEVKVGDQPARIRIRIQ
jgi:isoleucyl-tRNA synthetase